MKNNKKIGEIGILLLLPLSIITVPAYLTYKKIKSMRQLSFLGRNDLARGIRNNNPFNLIKTQIDWKKKVPHDQNTDIHFEQFETLEYGIRAGLMQVRNDIKKGYDTIDLLIHKFAPPVENDTNQYAYQVAQSTKIGIKEKLQPDRKTVIAISRAICRHENGKDANLIPNRLFELAYLLL